MSELARKTDLSQSSTAKWSRLPAEQARTVETAPAMFRTPLQPDVEVDATKTDSLDDIDSARAQEYALLAALLARAPEAALLDRLATLRGDASPLGIAHSALAEAALRTTPDRLQREYFALFVGLGRGELLPYGSYYLTGFLHERPLQRLRQDLVELGIERSAGNIEPEDHAAILCEVMAGLAERRFAAPTGSDQRIFERHLKPWLGRFFSDLERAETADFYARVGAVGRVFMDIETEAFALPS
jgi:TorA maturation chaperone TorD